ncbi:hypothetical protein HMPREF9318_00365 [Streptococcus urinalis FB127-CNA-2]|uniref:TraX domain protein n=1 Tax=Streptococcus urinalis 2285-97 TaxID=764291 RepID=G5KFV7_9STRE|nr:TraX family protein [Streptococcus urinalis]EHJ56965.1 TraX domain protein [Streptococcus urinalis 2285-97]EKS22167.1 hypothetical protein HMPREF9318_00365 [Streptococcus urinalis FB127-CNA-2]VEF31979.1 fimbrial assembly protein fimC [Streptococcus urinalis]
MHIKFNAFHLKIIAIIAMFINHFGHVFQVANSYPYLYFLTEFIGLFTFPIMAYLLVEGFIYTKNVKKYALRLFIFALLSILPFTFQVYYQTIYYSPYSLVFYP